MPSALLWCQGEAGRYPRLSDIHVQTGQLPPSYPGASASAGGCQPTLGAPRPGLDATTSPPDSVLAWTRGGPQYHRSSCEECDVLAPSQAAEELIITPPPEYPFQMMIEDMFQHDGHSYMAYADRLTGWLELAHFPHGISSSHIKTQLRRYFAWWGDPVQISSDGGSNLASEEMGEFFKLWGVSVRLSSAQYPQSNGRAEAAVKIRKQVIMANMGSGGNLNMDKSSMAMLQYLNTPLRGINKSPAQMAAGRQLRDGVPMARWHLTADKHWGQP
ncbi:uncharacterized protein [Palaemon carinicauda]|uniref:uncharacterized protein n=1 Tax=Palaemon carinicauda TaxID=392227 RepID=UPI0035B63A9D